MRVACARVRGSLRLACRVDEDILGMLRTLAQDSANIIVIVSGATTAKLCTAFLPLLDQSSVWLAAENGAFMRPPRSLWDAFSVSEGTEWICLYENLSFSWVKSVEQVSPRVRACTARHACARARACVRASRAAGDMWWRGAGV
jgi:hypothetical protein